MTPETVARSLRLGRDSARTIGSIAEQFGVPRRTIERSIEQLRRSGRPICTGNDGVWLTQSASELQEQSQLLRKRAIQILLGSRALRATARRFSAQLSLWERVA